MVCEIGAVQGGEVGGREGLGVLLVLMEMEMISEIVAIYGNVIYQESKSLYCC